MKLSLLAASWIGAAAIIGGGLVSPAAANHPDTLWQVVHGLCLRDMRLTGRPAPCLHVDRDKGYAVVPDLKRSSQVLLVPTARIAGIESVELLAPGAPNYWQAAWESRRYVERRLGRRIPRDLVGMAINSPYSRSQDQLHIHVDCVRPVLRDVLAAQTGRIGFVWAYLHGPLGQPWKVRSLRGEDLGEHDPFKLLARGDAKARAHMNRQTLVVVGATLADGSPGFYLLSSDTGSGFGEGLLDHRCAVLTQDRAPTAAST